MPRLVVTVAVATSATLFFWACVPKPGATPSPAAGAPAAIAQSAPPSCPNEPGLCFLVAPSDTVLELNGELLGTVAAGGSATPHFVPRPAGIYQITLRHDGYRAWRGEVSVQEGAERIEVSLTADEPHR
ncbi:MAG: PEGA domain-containing protein [Myxococcota bacterium]